MARGHYYDKASNSSGSNSNDAYCALFGGATHYDSAILSLTLGESCAFEPYELYREADEFVEIRWHHGGHADARIEGNRLIATGLSCGTDGLLIKLHAGQDSAFVRTTISVVGAEPEEPELEEPEPESNTGGNATSGSSTHHSSGNDGVYWPDASKDTTPTFEPEPEPGETEIKEPEPEGAPANVTNNPYTGR